MFMWSATASESSAVIGPTSRRTRPRLSRSRVRSVGSSSRSEVSLRTSMGRLSSLVMRDELTELTGRLVELDSVNPDLVPGGAGEGDVARFVAEWLEGAGFE